MIWPTGGSQWESGSPEGSPWHQSISPATTTSPAWTDPSPAGYPPGLGFGPPSAPGQPDPTPAAPMDPDAWEVSDAWDEDDKAPDVAPTPDQAPARAATAAPWLAPASYGAGAPAAQPALAPPPGLGPDSSLVNPKASGHAAPWLTAAAASTLAQPWAAERVPQAPNAARWAPGSAAQANQLHGAAEAVSALSGYGEHPRSAAQAPGALGSSKPYQGYGAAQGYDNVRQCATLAAPPPDLLPGAAGRGPALPLPLWMPAPEGAVYMGGRGTAGVQTRSAERPSVRMAGAAGAQSWGTAGFAAGVGPGSAERPAISGYATAPGVRPGGVGFRKQGAAPPLPNMDVESDDDFDFGAPPLPEVQSHI